MILHLIEDEKFIDAAMEHFDRVSSSKNMYVLFNNKNTPELKYLKNNENVISIKSNIKYEVFLEFIVKNNITVIAIHFLTFQKVEICNWLKKTNPKLKFIWFFWGADGYDLAKMRYNLLLPKTESIVSKLEYKSSAIRLLKNSLRFLSKSGLYVEDYLKLRRRKIGFLKEIDFIVPVVEDDFLLLKSRYPINAQMIEWHYLSIEQVLIDNLEMLVNGNNILIGNSATPTNNHIEIIDILSKLDLGNRKIIAPLSYGDNKYKKFVIEYGHEKLGSSFVALVDFLPLYEYNKIIRSCGFVIMNSVRQQAMGNIISSLYMGAKVFLNERSPIFKYLKRNKVNLFSLETDLNTLKFQLNEDLSEQERYENTDVLYKILGKPALKKKTNDLVNLITGYNE